MGLIIFVSGYCEHPFLRAYLTAEGFLGFCPFMKPGTVSPIKDAYLGNLLNQTFDEIWFGQEAEAVRDNVISGSLHKKCCVFGCPFANASLPLMSKKIEFNEYPGFLEIELPNTHCNVGGFRPDPVKSPACVMCERNSPSFLPQENRLFEVLPKITHLLPNLCQIVFRGDAEPFFKVSSDRHLLFEILKALEFDGYAHQIALHITTNGALLNRVVRQEYVNAAPHSMTCFSLDAATPKTYQRIRILDCFIEIVNNLFEFSAERTRERQFLKVHCSINLLNLHEVIGMVHIARQAQADEIEFVPTWGFNRQILVNKQNCGLFAKAEQEIISECQKIGLAYRFVQPLDLGMMQPI